MKVYLLTFHGSVNYGAVLQALALSKTLGSLGYACEVIDYNRELHHKNFLKSYSKSFKGKLYQALQYPQKFKLHKKFDSFIKANMPLSSKAYNGFGALSSEVFDENAAFIVGSDQVWNCELTENNYHYFLDFTASENKFSYAASFGVSDISGWENKARVLELLQQFKSISVREESGAEIIKKELNRESTVVCDPTFLLEKSDWEQVASLNDRGKYVLLFMLSYNKDLHERARELAKQKNLPLVNLAYSVKNIEGAENVPNLSPDEWLGYIANADYVFTNSFHGFSLSLNFNRQVFVALTRGSRNSRILDLARRYGVEDRIISNEKLCSDDIDYSLVLPKMQADREKSLDYIKGILKERQ